MMGVGLKVSTLRARLAEIQQTGQQALRARAAAITVGRREKSGPGLRPRSRKNDYPMVNIETQATRKAAFPRRALIVALLSLLGAFAVVLSGHSSGFLQRLEQGLSDLRTAFFSDRITGDHPDIVIVSVGENVNATRAAFEQGSTEVDRGQLARLIEAIDEAAPRAIGFDVPLKGAQDGAKDEALQRALRQARARVILGTRRTGQSEAGLEREAWLQRFISGTGRPVGHISTVYDEGDGRVVGIDAPGIAMGRLPDSFASLMARALRPEVTRDLGSIAWLQKVDERDWLSRISNIGAQQPFRIVYGDEILDKAKPLPSRVLAGRLVIVTTGLADIERHRTPLTTWTGEMLAPIQIQAQAIAQMLDRRVINDISSRTARLALFALACVAGIVGWYRGPGLHIVGTVIAILGLIALDAMAYSMRDVVLPLAPGLVVWLLGEAAGRSLRGILNWEELYGFRWPMGPRPGIV